MTQTENGAGNGKNGVGASLELKWLQVRGALWEGQLHSRKAFLHFNLGLGRRAHFSAKVRPGHPC